MANGEEIQRLLAIRTELSGQLRAAQMAADQAESRALAMRLGAAEDSLSAVLAKADRWYVPQAHMLADEIEERIRIEQPRARLDPQGTSSAFHAAVLFGRERQAATLAELNRHEVAWEANTYPSVEKLIQRALLAKRSPLPWDEIERDIRAELDGLMERWQPSRRYLNRLHQAQLDRGELVAANTLTDRPVRAGILF